MASALVTQAMLSLSNRQLQIVMDAARGLSIEKRGQFLQRIAATLQLRGRFDLMALARSPLA